MPVVMKGASPYKDMHSENSMNIMEKFVGEKEELIEFSVVNPTSSRTRSIYDKLSNLPSHLPHLSIQNWPIQ